MARGEKIALGEIRAPEDRVLRITNVHWNATEAEIIELFDGYDVIDCKRYFHANSGKSSVAYVLLSALEDVIRAIEELHMKELLGRKAKVMRAKGGFKLTISGLLDLTDAGDETAATRPLQSPSTVKELVIPLSKHDLSFPPLPGAPKVNPVQTKSYSSLLRPPLEPPALITTEEHRPKRMLQFRRRQRPQTAFDGPEYRVLLISNLHQSANRGAIELFFHGFRILDYKRKYNDRLQKYHSTAFVLFESVHDRDVAKVMRNGEKIFGREVTLENATRGIRVSEDCFLPDDEEDMGATTNSQPRVLDRKMSPTTVSTVPTGYHSEALHLPHTWNPYGRGQVPNEAPPSETQSSFIPHEQAYRYLDHYWRYAHTPTLPAAHTNNEPVESTRSISPKTQAWRAPKSIRELLGEADEQPLFFRDPWREVHLAVGNEVASHRGFGRWNLSGNDSEDKKYNILTEMEWYAFQ